MIIFNIYEALLLGQAFVISFYFSDDLLREFLLLFSLLQMKKLQI